MSAAGGTPDAPLRWTLVATPVPPGGSLGGIVRYTTELLRALARRDDVALTVVGVRGAVPFLTDLVGPRARVLAVPDAPVPVLSVVERYAPLPGTAGADVVQGVKHLVPARSRALRVMTVHDLLLLDRTTDFGVGKRLLLPPFFRASLADTDVPVCVSAATRARLAAHDPAAAERAVVVPLATSTSLREAVAVTPPALAGRRYALVVGDPSPRKNLATLLAAWPAVRAAVPDAVLAIAGPPSWGRTEVGDLYQHLVGTGAVVALGHVSDAELRGAYEGAALVLCPSLAEGFGLPAAEALHFGAPLVVSDDAALREVAAGRERAVVPALDVAGWSAAAVAVLTGSPRESSGPAAADRGWDDVAAGTVAAARAALAARAGAGAGR